eukprot:SAG31_NODE_17580_length_665_cov_1.597173_1_plen_78_part_00
MWAAGPGGVGRRGVRGRTILTTKFSPSYICLQYMNGGTGTFAFGTDVIGFARVHLLEINYELLNLVLVLESTGTFFT